MESGALGMPAVVVHGGAGEFGRQSSSAQLARIEEDLSGALEAAWQVLDMRGRALDSVIEAVACMEASGNFNCGRGAVATSQGTVETDAAVMDGTSGSFGAICAATWPESPVRAAQAVMGLGGPAEGPVLLAGAGADRFCESAGLATESSGLALWRGCLADLPRRNGGGRGGRPGRPSRRCHVHGRTSRQAARAGGRLADRRSGNLGGRPERRCLGEWRRRVVPRGRLCSPGRLVRHGRNDAGRGTRGRARGGSFTRRARWRDRTGARRALRCRVRHLRHGTRLAGPEWH